MVISLKFTQNYPFLSTPSPNSKYFIPSSFPFTIWKRKRLLSSASVACSCTIGDGGEYGIVSTILLA